MILKTTTNTGKNKKKCSRNLRRKGRSQLNQNLYPERLIYGLLDVLIKPVGTANTKIMRFQKETKLQKTQLFF